MDNNYTHISIVLDRSGSMDSIKKDTIGGFNTFLKAQKEAPGKATLSLIRFDNFYEPVYEMVEIQSVKDLDSSNFVPRGSTALLDAIGQTINDTGAKLNAMAEDKKPSKVLFVIITDGEENSSREFTKDQINKMITEQRETWKWEFVFLAATQDAIQTGIDYGIGVRNSMSYQATGKGTQAMYATLNANTTSYRSGAKADMSFTDADKDILSSIGDTN